MRFTFLTGISKFSKVNLFSQLNNLTDLTLDPVYSSICGYTEGSLDTVFAPELAGLDRERVREWYNGYSWLGTEKVYNPYDVLLLFRRREFAAHWFETGTPAFLLDTLIERPVATVTLDRTVSTAELLSTFDVGNIATEALLFQTGYLTITGKEELGGMAPGADARGTRLCGTRGPVRGRGQQRHRPLRGILRERGVLLFRGAGVRDRGRRLEQPQPARHGGEDRRACVSVRVQGGRDGLALLRTCTRRSAAPAMLRAQGARAPSRARLAHREVLALAWPAGHTPRPRMGTDAIHSSRRLALTRRDERGERGGSHLTPISVGLYTRSPMGTDAIHPNCRLAVTQRDERVERVGSRLTRVRTRLYTRPRMGTDTIQPSRCLALTQPTTRLPDYRAPLAAQPTEPRATARCRC